MNKGTKIRTAMIVIVLINQTIATIGDIDFGHEYVNIAYRVISTIVSIVATTIVTYFNQDYTEEGAIGTGVTRQMKIESTDDYIGEKFFDEEK